MARRSTLDKQAVVDEITDLLGIDRDELGNGSKEHIKLLRDIADSLGLSRSGVKHVVAQRVVEELGQPWDRSCYSRGGSVQTTAFKRMRDALRAQVGRERADFETRVSRLLREGVQRKPKGNEKPRRGSGSAGEFIRCPEVVVWVLQCANGTCELCTTPAPFERPNGTPYLEVHHVKPLAEGGPDTVDNAIALCPNCHRKAHYGMDRRQIRIDLQRRVKARR